MTKDEALQIPDLCINVTPVVEDAFYFLSHLENQKPIDEILNMSEEEEKDYDLICDASQHAGDRLLKVPKDERMEAVRLAYQMIDNIRKYGVACYDWINA